MRVRTCGLQQPVRHEGDQEQDTGTPHHSLYQETGMDTGTPHHSLYQDTGMDSGTSREDNTILNKTKNAILGRFLMLSFCIRNTGLFEQKTVTVLLLKTLYIFYRLLTFIKQFFESK